MNEEEKRWDKNYNLKMLQLPSDKNIHKNHLQAVSNISIPNQAEIPYQSTTIQIQTIVQIMEQITFP